MGRDFELFVHPERISSQLICPICTQVLQSPVQTSTEHLFCEDELLEWMTRSSKCPVTGGELNPNSIRKPGRIILNMLAELEMYCSNKSHGCTWTGPSEHLSTHARNCQHKSVEVLSKTIQEKDSEILVLHDRIEQLELRNDELLQENLELKIQLKDNEKKLRIYNAFLLKNETPSSVDNRIIEAFETSTLDDSSDYDDLFHNDASQSPGISNYKSHSYNQKHLSIYDNKMTDNDIDSNRSSSIATGGTGSSNIRRMVHQRQQVNLLPAAAVYSDADRLTRLRTLRSLQENEANNSGVSSSNEKSTRGGGGGWSSHK